MKNKLNWLEAALLIAPFVLLAAFWNKLPARVPDHWNLQGQIDGWASKPRGILMLPLTGLGVVMFCASFSNSSSARARLAFSL